MVYPASHAAAAADDDDVYVGAVGVGAVVSPVPNCVARFFGGLGHRGDCAPCAV